jgi:hydrogenase maturation protease
MSVAVVIGVGNSFRRDDGVGVVVAEAIAQRKLSGVQVVTDIGDPATILESWAGVRLAVVVDAAMGNGGEPGRIRRWTPNEEPATNVVTSHTMGLTQAYALGEALGQIPDRLVILTVDIVDADYGVGLTPSVAAAVPGVVEAVLAELAGDLRRCVRD